MPWTTLPSPSSSQKGLAVQGQAPKHCSTRWPDRWSALYVAPVQPSLMEYSPRDVFLLHFITMTIVSLAILNINTTKRSASDVDSSLILCDICMRSLQVSVTAGKTFQVFFPLPAYVETVSHPASARNTGSLAQANCWQFHEFQCV